MITSIKYFIYARKSTDREDKQVASIEDQIFEVQKIARNKDLVIADIISEAQSAKEPGRDGFNSMLKRIQKGEAQGILCWKLNRLARNPVDGGQISWMLQQNIIRHIQTFGSEYHPKDNVIVMNVEFGMANQYVKDLSVDTKRGMRRKAQRGWLASPVLPIGYLHNPNRNLDSSEDEIIIDPVRFKLVKKLWKLLLTGEYTIAELHDKSIAIGLRNNKGKPYHLNTIRKIFENTFYAGYFKWKDEEEEMVKLQGKHRNMISQSEYKAAQYILKGKSRPTRHFKRMLPYAGVLKCGSCTSAVCGDRKIQVICTGCKNKFSVKSTTICSRCFLDVSKMKKPVYVDHTYYRCTRRRNNCKEQAIKEEEIENQIASMLDKIEINKEYCDYLINLLKSYNSVVDDLDSRKELKKAIKKLDNKLQSYLDLRADGEIDTEEYKLAKNRITEEKQKLEKELSQLDYEDANWISDLQRKVRLLDRAREVYVNGVNEKKKEVIRGLRSNLLLKEKKLYFTIPKTISVLEEGFKVYSAYFSTLEPKNSVEKYRSLNCFEDLNLLLLPIMCKARTNSSRDYTKLKTNS